MLVYDVDSLCILEVNDSAERQYGYTRSEFLSRTFNDLQASQDIEALFSKESESYCVHVKRDGTRFYVSTHENDIQFHGSRGRFVVAEDVTERLQAHAQLLKLAHHDALTGLPNRSMLEQRISQGLSAARERSHRAAIICLDLDRFKQVNDRYGHAAGDECLRRAATLLTRRLRGMDTVARTGGEEFTILLGEVESVTAAGVVAKALLQVFSVPIQIDDHHIVLGASIGVAVYPDHGTEGPELWRKADAAMYRAKRAGGNQHVLLSTGVTTAAAETAGVESHMQSMLDNGECRLEYQIQYNLNGQIRGMEALLRLPDSSVGAVSPDRFIPMAEENGLIHPLGRWVIEQACRQLMIWNSERSTPLCISVNVSPLQLMRLDFVKEVWNAISTSGIDPGWLEMEITERVVLDFDVIARRMAQLADIGIRFALDDFGTGYSSLQHLHRLPISTLKIDCSFIQQLCESRRSYSIVKSIVAMGHSLDLEVIAEGVENEHQVRILRELKCDCIQGFLLSRPSPPEALYALLFGVDSARPRQISDVPNTGSLAAASTGLFSVRRPYGL